MLQFSLENEGTGEYLLDVEGERSGLLQFRKKENDKNVVTLDIC